MTSQDATVVLVHGAWHGPWCWEKVVERLEAAGLQAVTVDNPSVAEPPATMHDDADNVRRVLDGIEAPVMLVGHSYGGAVITDAGAHDAVRHLVYLTAFMLDDGESVMQNALQGGEGSELVAALRFDGDVVKLDDATSASAFYHDCNDDDVRDAIAQLRPQSLATLTETPRQIAWKSRPSTYIVCTDDRALPVALQQACAARANDVVEIDASHSPFLSMPDQLAELLIELSRGARGA